MKRIFNILILCILSFSTTVFAQTETIYPTNIKKEYPKHEIGMSYGIFPIIGVGYMQDGYGISPFVADIPIFYNLNVLYNTA